jgi:hypothetical protein
LGPDRLLNPLLFLRIPAWAFQNAFGGSAANQGAADLDPRLHVILKRWKAVAYGQFSW